MPRYTSPVQGAGIVVEEVAEPTEEHLAALARLLPQLSSTAVVPSREDLRSILAEDGGVRLLAARLAVEEGLIDEGTVVGFAVLVVFTTLTGKRAWLEDVVVDTSVRNRGIGQHLVRAVVEAATSAGCRTLDLTSRPSREAANRLYRRCGFEQRTTNVWRRQLGT